jgi:Zinc carboxypeptidase
MSGSPLRHSIVVRLLLAVAFLAALASPERTRAQAVREASAAVEVPSPEVFFGFRMGADRELAAWNEIEGYFRRVDAASDRVELVDIGPSTEGNRIIGAIISAPENIRNLEAIKAANRRLADPRSLSDDEAQRIIDSHKAVLAIGCSIHASEIGATQAANELLHSLATATDAGTQAVLRDTIIILFPSLNPDGHILTVDWYRRNKGTPLEGAPMPWLYHKYVGHDINRDAFMMNMPENRNLSRFFYNEWHPQVFLTLHQMGMRGPRFFVPPNYDPIDPNYDPLIWREAGLLGHAMALALEQDNRSGVISNAMYDYYWPGYEDSAPLGHNTVCLLTEVASVRVATPITVDPNELTGTPRGLPEYRTQMNFPNPWPGGRWRLRDIVEYDLTAVRGLLNAVAAYRKDLVGNFYTMGRRAVEAGRNGGPFAFFILPDQHDPHAAARLANLLIDGKVEIYRTLEPFRADGEVYQAGTDIVFMAQPFRAYAKTLLEVQKYPVRKDAVSQADRPYDVAGWTLPLQMGVDVRTIERYFEAPAMTRLERVAVSPARVWGNRRSGFFLIDARGNAGAIAANRLLKANLEPAWITKAMDVEGFRYLPGSLVVRGRDAEQAVDAIATQLGLRATGVKGRIPADAMALRQTRVGLYKPFVENIDEGWTRWLLEQYEFPYQSISDPDVRLGNLRARFDVIILPDAAPERLVSGHPPGTVPPEYTGGLTQQGVTALEQFVLAGGTLICLDSSGALAIDAFRIPVRDVVREASVDQFFCPGSILKLELDPAQPLAFGMRPQTAAFFGYSAAYEPRQNAEPPARPPGGEAGHQQLQVIGRYGARDLLMSGWLHGEGVIAGRAAAVEARHGAGRIVLLGFRVQHRAQSHATFRLLFNAILTSVTSNSDGQTR